MKKKLKSQLMDELRWYTQEGTYKSPPGGLAHLLPYNLPREDQEVIEKARVIISKLETEQQRFWASLCSHYPSYEGED